MIEKRDAGRKRKGWKRDTWTGGEEIGMRGREDGDVERREM